jgi:adenylosuccinate lyase
MGEMPNSDLAVIKQKAKFEVKRILEIEETTKHDVIAFLTNVAEFVGEPSRHIHYGMTSSDILDTTLSFQMKSAGEILLKKLDTLKLALKKRAEETKYMLCIGRSHGVHAEPTTMGLKFALWFEECKRNISRLEKAIEVIGFGKISGAVGTFEHLSPKVEEYVCKKLNLKPDPVSTQIVQRDRHAEFMLTLSIIASSLEKIALEIRHLQKTEVLEAEEYFSKGQKGSSAMPHKRNPVVSERVAGISRIIRTNALASLENIPLWHERDISHSSTERIIIPDSCIGLDYILNQTIKLVEKLILYPDNMKKNLNLTRGLVFSQTVLLALITKGVSREDSYKLVQDCAMAVWNDQNKNLKNELLDSSEVRKYLSADEINYIFESKKMLSNVDYIFKRTIETE